MPHVRQSSVRLAWNWRRTTPAALASDILMHNGHCREQQQPLARTTAGLVAAAMSGTRSAREECAPPASTKNSKLARQRSRATLLFPVQHDGYSRHHLPSPTIAPPHVYYVTVLLKRLLLGGSPAIPTPIPSRSDCSNVTVNVCHYSGVMIFRNIYVSEPLGSFYSPTTIPSLQSEIRCHQFL